MPRKRKAGRPKNPPGVGLTAQSTLYLPRSLDQAVRKDAAGRYETRSQWFRNAIVAHLKRHGAMPEG
ncbi:MAG: hypothetical protein ACYTBJ_01800 [Planctomycetota bacterium]